MDERLGSAGPLRKQLNKVFPDHWSFMLGEIALYSFIVLILTGTYLAFFFEPSLSEIKYHGSYTPLHDVTMSKAFASTLKISFDVRGGLIIRQIHHWAALLFVASIIVHMLRIFFTGAFRKPREMNWVIGIALLWTGILEGFLGYSLPDDALSGTGLRIGNSIVLSIPVIGTWLSYLVWGGEFPGPGVIQPRMYIVHVLVLPGLILALIALHLTLVVVQKHTQFPGRRRTEKNVVGERVLPHYAAKAGGLAMIVFGVLALIGGLVQINPVWIYGPYEPYVGSTGSQPDWYMGVIEGAIRIFPPWAIKTAGHTVPAPFWPAAAFPIVAAVAMLCYPFFERRFSRDRSYHNLLQRPRDVPVRTSLGVMAMSAGILLLIWGGDDIVAEKFNIDINTMIWMGRVLFLLVPPIAYVVTYRACLSLEQKDRRILEEGIETGMLRRVPSGGYMEIHQPLADEEQPPLEYAGTPVPKRVNGLYDTGRRAVGFLKPVELPPSDGQTEDEHSDQKHPVPRS